MFLYDRYRPMPRKQSEMLQQIGYFALDFKYYTIDTLHRWSVYKKYNIFEDVAECWEYVHGPCNIETNPFKSIAPLTNNTVFEHQWMMLVEWLDRLERGLDIKTEHACVVYHMCKRLMTIVNRSF